VLKSKCLRIATNTYWYVGNRQIHEHLGIPFFADHIRALTKTFGLNLSDAGAPYFGNFEGTYLYYGLSEVPYGQAKRTDVQQASKSHPYKAAKSKQRAVPNTARLPRLSFSVL